MLITTARTPKKHRRAALVTRITTPSQTRARSVTRTFQLREESPSLIMFSQLSRQTHRRYRDSSDGRNVTALEEIVDDFKGRGNVHLA
jgi:hypothetical protein